MAGDFRSGFSIALGDTLLGASLDTLRREFPRLHLSVASDESESLISRIQKRELDAAVARGLRLADRNRGGDAAHGNDRGSGARKSFGSREVRDLGN